MKRSSKGSADIMALMARLQEQVAQLDRKLDVLMARSQAQPKPAPQSPKPDHQQGRVMYKATCADCKKDCEVPFNPTGDRPVYCQECFRHRKAINTLKLATDSKPKAAQPAQVIISASSAAPVAVPKEKKKTPAVKKVALKTRPAPKRKK